MSNSKNQELNKKFGLDKSYHHDIDDNTKQCKKCHQTINKLRIKLCPVVGQKEFNNMRNYKNE